jgi:UDP-N-acetylglucosamine 2-epimerase
MLTVFTIIGTRPEAIKLAPVIRQFRQRLDRVRVVVCVTGQHRELLDPMLAFFEIRPDYDLNLMRPRQSLAYLTAAALQQLQEPLQIEKPDWMLVQGDTTTALSGALAASYHQIKVGHIEAGLRTGDVRRPFPEEMNRRLIDHISTLLFAPTKTARQNLLNEGIAAEAIHLTGNTGLEALLQAISIEFDWGATSPLALLPRRRRLILVTAHRRETVGEPLRQVCLAIRELAQRHDDGHHFVMPIHPNPDISAITSDILEHQPNISLVEPLDYLSLIHLMRRCHLILTDSGGIQEEAATLGVPCLVLRDVTDRPETIEAGIAKLVGLDKERIIAETTALLNSPDLYEPMAKAHNLYGDGKAAERIVKIVLGAKS